MLAQRAQRLSDQQSFRLRTHAGELHAAVGEVDHLQRAGVREQVRDVVGDEFLGADPHVDGEAALGEQLRARCVFGGADARDACWRAIQELCDLAGDDVDLVAVGQRNQYIGVGDAGGFQYRRMGGVAGHRADVDAILQVAQHLLIVVDDGDFVGGLARQALRRGAAHLPGAEDQYFHRCTITPAPAGRH